MCAAAKVSGGHMASGLPLNGSRQDVVTRTGERFLLRMTEKGDEPIVRDLLMRERKEDLRSRFFISVTCFDDAFVSRLLCVENARTASLIAIDANVGDAGGLACLHQESDVRCAEFAILVRSDLKGHGLGWRLMEYLIAWARAKDYETIEGFVLRANSAMIEFCRSLGFKFVAVDEAPLFTKAVLSLADVPHL